MEEENTTEEDTTSEMEMKGKNGRGRSALETIFRRSSP